MDLRHTAEEIAFRNEVRTFFQSSLPTDIRRKQVFGQRLSKQDIVTWQRILNKKGWAVPMWPMEYGGTGWDAVRYFIFREEMHLAYAPDPLGFNTNLVGPVICRFGTEEQKEWFLPKIRNLDIWFCQGFSEPGSGSDLASLKTRAEHDGDHYLVNGQKLWTSNGHNADWMFGLVRTDPNAKKQKGITYLLIDMKSPGLQVRPVITLDGDHHTNETFFDNVRVPMKNRIGEENRGWDYAKFLLGNERAGVARVGLCKQRLLNIKRRAADIMVEGKPLSEDARFREKMALIEVELKALEITNMMVVANMKKQAGHQQDPRASVLKIKGSELQQATLELMLEVAGPNAMPRQLAFMEARTDEVIGAEWTATAAPNHYFGRAISIFGGSNEIQHNIVAKAILGL
jgi:alkylation response protein AidB-like acyl-CoA dehydrogenase